MAQKLFSYQETGVEFLMSHDVCYLRDDMGLGKSLQALTAAERSGFKRILTLLKLGQHVPKLGEHLWVAVALLLDPPFALLDRNINGSVEQVVQSAKVVVIHRRSLPTVPKASFRRDSAHLS